MNLPYIMSWNITNRCNMACTYCNLSFNQGEGELSYEEAIQVIDILVENKIFIISFSGGEPFCREDFMDILKYAADHKITSLIATNGQFLTRELVNKLKDLRVSAVAVSLDSFTKELNEKFRGFGTYEPAIRSMKYIKEVGLGLILSIGVYESNYHEYQDFLEKAYELGADRVKVQIFVQENEEGMELILNNSQLVSLQEQTKNFLKKIGKEDWVKFTCHNNYLYYDYTDFDQPVCKSRKKKGIIQANGDIILCEFYPEHTIGNIIKDNFVTMWKERAELFSFKERRYLEPCNSCQYLDICKGGCKVFSQQPSLSSPYFGDKNCPMYLKKS